MKKSTKLWLIVAAILFLSGGIIFVSTLWANNWDFKAFSTEVFETKEFNITEDFNSISIGGEADITFLKSADNTARVVSIENKKSPLTVSVEDGVLTVNRKNPKKWYENITILSFESPKITVYLPKESYSALTIDTNTGDVEIPKDFKFSDIEIEGSTCDVFCYAFAENSLSVKVSTGDIKIKGITTKSLTLSVSTGKITASDITANKAKVNASTGDIKLKDFNCKTFTSSASTGDITLEKLIAEKSLIIGRSTGDIKLMGCDAGEISIKTSTGEVSGSLLSDKIFIAKSNTGNINLPKTTKGGKCEITTDTGDIKIEIK